VAEIHLVLTSQLANHIKRKRFCFWSTRLSYSTLGSRTEHLSKMQGSCGSSLYTLSSRLLLLLCALAVPCRGMASSAKSEKQNYAVELG
jgi:hypothetical protein